MCGLFGIVNPSALDRATIHRADLARDTLVHRGPDNGDAFCDNNVYLGHRRLSIIDTSALANQPMIGDRAVITVNGEVYNFRSLRKELEAEGARFVSSSDSEVLLHGYQIWGIDKLAERIDGMYVAVIYDKLHRKVFIMRDRVGIKPLYYFYNRKTFAYASELKALRRYLGEGALSINPESIIDYLTYRYIPAPKSLYNNIHKLPAASVLQLDADNPRQLRVTRYWSLPVETCADASTESLSSELLELLGESVAAQMVSDVPLGLLLSGGLDSSSVAAMAVEKNVEPLSFTIGFREKEHDESSYADIVSGALGTKHRVLYLEREEMGDLANSMASWFDEPFGDTSAVPTYRVSAFARQYVTVALSGDGGDELLGGYGWYRRYEKLLEHSRIAPFKLRHGLPFKSASRRMRHLSCLLTSDPVGVYAGLRGSLSYNRLQKMKSTLGVRKDYDHLWAYRAHYDARRSPIQNARIMDFHTYLPDDILTKVDRVSMAVSLECRPPFLSRKLVEFCYSLPERYVMLGGELKGGLKHALRGKLPSEILFRKKQGFSVPDFGWRRAAEQESGSLQEYLLRPFLRSSDSLRRSMKI